MRDEGSLYTGLARQNCSQKRTPGREGPDKPYLRDASISKTRVLRRSVWSLLAQSYAAIIPPEPDMECACAHKRAWAPCQDKSLPFLEKKGWITSTFFYFCSTIPSPCLFCHYDMILAPWRVPFPLNAKISTRIYLCVVNREPPFLFGTKVIHGGG